MGRTRGRRTEGRRHLAVALALALAAGIGSASAARAQTTELVSEDETGLFLTPGVDCTDPSISADGRFVAFVSTGTRGSSTTDVFVRDRTTGAIERISVDAAGEPAQGSSTSPSISADGRFVAFVSGAADLVPGVFSDRSPVYVRDRVAGVTEIASVDASGQPVSGFEPAISADGRFVAFVADSVPLDPTASADPNASGAQVYVRDRRTRQIRLLSADAVRNAGNAPSRAPAISANGRFVAFLSAASNLVPDDTNQNFDVFVADRETGEVERASVDSAGRQATGQTGYLFLQGSGPAISANGRFVAFASDATNFDSSGFTHVFVRDRALGVTERASVDAKGERAYGGGDAPAISADGRFVAFVSTAGISPPDGRLHDPSVFVYDRRSGSSRLVSANLEGGRGIGGGSPVLSADGRLVAFISYATDLVAGPAREGRNLDVFLRDRGATGLRAPDSFAVFEKDGFEVITRLGDHDAFDGSFTPAPDEPPFNGTFKGARFAMIGVFDADAKNPDGSPLANVLFSGQSDPNGLSDGAITSVFRSLVGESGFLAAWRHLPPDGRENSGVISTADPHSLSQTLGGALAIADGASVYPIAVPLHTRSLPVPVPGFGASAGYARSGASRGRAFSEDFPLLVNGGEISRLRPEDLPLPSELYAVLMKDGLECIFTVGDDLLRGTDATLRTTPSFYCPNVLRDGVAGTRLAFVGVFDLYNERPNLMFSAAQGTLPALDEAAVARAFSALIREDRTGFLDTLPAPYGSAELAASDPRSYESRVLGGAEASAFPAPIVLDSDLGTFRVLVFGAAGAPLERAQILEITVQIPVLGDLLFTARSTL